MTSPTIVVPLDGSEHALVALPVAKQLAQLEAATLHLVHVAREVSPPAEILQRIGLTELELRGSVLDTRAGEPAPGIVQIATELHAVLVVLCTHTVLPVAETPLGDTALAVLQGGPCPVVLVRPERGIVPWSLRRILLPHDGTPTTSAAIRPAAELARRAGAALDVLHVAGPGLGPPAERGSLTSPRYLDQPQHEWPAWVGEFVERLGCVCPIESLQVRMFLGEGAPGDETLRVAAEQASDLVVLAWHGDWEAAHAVTVKTVLRRAACPVMVIRE
jgi:nucleotide-binding universal stress UspA family protein